ncbi:MAG: Uma2 family endonuclease [Methyloprofundus sp.]|nr:Uma2 family endonuclease [Methyloprofundus sp.]
MLAKKENDFIGAEDYLQSELNRDTKHELINGKISAMAEASKNHERLSGNIYAEFRHHLKGSPCEMFSSDMKLKVSSNFFYPDVMVVCDDNTENDYYTESPAIVVEVLSKSTRRIDETIKLMSYINIPSVQEYVIIEQDVVDIQVLRRSENWLPKHYFLGDEVEFASIDLVLSVEDIYERVQNEDVTEFLNAKIL